MDSAAPPVIPSDMTCPSVLAGFEYDGVEISNFTANDASVCCDWCSQNAECTSWTWNRDAEICFLKSGDGNSTSVSSPSLTGRSGGAQGLSTPVIAAIAAGGSLVFLAVAYMCCCKSEREGGDDGSRYEKMSQHASTNR